MSERGAPPDGPGPDARSWRRYLRIWRRRVDADVEDELRFHLDMRVRDYRQRGLAPDEAERAAMARLGDLRGARDTCVAMGERRERRMTYVQTIDALMQDVRFGLRTLARQKGWTAVAVTTLALGIGANTAMFSVVDRLVLHPLAYPNADRIAIAYQEPTEGNNTGMHVMITPNASTVRAWRDGARSFESLEPYATTDMTMQFGSAAPALVHTAAILPSFPAFAGEHVLLGRGFTDPDLADGHVAMLSEQAWRTRFGSDSGMIGRLLVLDDKPYTIIGVMPGALRLPRLTQDATDLWLPLDLRGNTLGLTVGRLRPGVSRAAAARELDSLAARAAAVSPGSRSPGFRATLLSPKEIVHFGDSLVMLEAAVALVLFIACANVAHLLLARAATRQREMAMRAALGAGTGRLFRLLLTESLLLSLAGCAGGIAVGWVGLRTIVALRPESLSALGAAEMNGTALLVTVAVSVATGLVFGLVGAFQAREHARHEALKAGARSMSASRGHRRMRSLLVVSEMALSATLLVGASLLVRSVMHLQSIDPGFNPADLYSVRATLPKSSYGKTEQELRFYTELVRRAGAIPGVKATALAGAAPPELSFRIVALQIDDEPAPAKGTTAFIRANSVGPNFFDVMGMRMVTGTTFTDTTEAGAQAIINEGLARKYWPGTSPLGHRLRVVYNGEGAWQRVVGVVANSSTGGLMSEASEPILYAPATGSSGPAVVVRVTRGVAPLPALRAAIRTIDPRLLPASITSIADVMRSSLAAPRFMMTVLTVFTLLAVALAAVGLYGVLAYTVAQRTREIGIRLALGATNGDVARVVLRQGLVLTSVGLVIGLAGARWATRLIGSMLYGVDRTDLASFALGAAVLLMTALVACVMPARRAVTVDPLTAMRAE
jgi:putative ABC transport system permease protein